ncbi:hypothetical protein CK623_04945 [Vandammella animalimorsus]|uniref:ATPase AAA-type core domain-containing protein n=1 Tax=Vandammella animalimorsus TaxID=2029117 RepID=A0A2A2ASL0_9BURK|nr:hypothetical protein CK623_04945 [Vandammella animalimorsus]
MQGPPWRRVVKLRIEKFAQIESAEIDFGQAGDLTILVGEQATGKSLVLQWLKLLTDRVAIRRTWEHYGINWRSGEHPSRPLDLFFGEGIGKGGYDFDHTRIELDGVSYKLDSLFRLPKGNAAAQKEQRAERTYYIPAHRALLLMDGWPLAFQQHRTGTPYVARAQSERILQWLNQSDKALFPIKNRLHASIRSLFSEAIFHGAALNIDRASQQSRLILSVSQASAIPYMAWTAGQREFVPLLLALYELMPAGRNTKVQAVDTVILEEPELGLHPKALFAVGVAVLHLMARGYRVILSTHSPLMVDFAWALNRLNTARKMDKASEQDVLKAFGLSANLTSKAVAVRLKDSRARVFYLGYQKQQRSQPASRVVSRDISDLRTYGPSDKPVWGDLLKYSTHLAEAIVQLDLDFSSLADEELRP